MKTRFRDGTGSRSYRFVIEDTDRHGNVRVYFRRKSQPKIRLAAQVGTPEFDAEYQRAHRGELNPKAAVKIGPAERGSLRWLCSEYFGSAIFKDLGPATRKSRRAILEAVSDLVGDIAAAEWEPRHVAKLRDRKSASPAAANEVVKALRQLFAWASSPEYGYIAGNPAAKVSYLGTRNPDGWRAWTERDVEKFTAFYPVGTRERLAIDLLLFTGVRRSDVVRLGPQMERNGYLIFTETKGRAHVKKTHRLPILADLRASIDATPTGHLVYLVNSDDRPWLPKTFSQWFERACRKAGVDAGLSAHGLRKLGAQLCVERGATEHQLMALYGWESPKQAAHYTRRANRERLEAEAAILLQNKVSHIGAAKQSGGTNEAKTG